MKKLRLIALAAALAAALSGCGVQTPTETPAPTPVPTEAPAEIYAYDGYAAREEYPLDEASLENAAARFRNVYDAYLAGTGSRVYLSVIPDKNYFLAGPAGKRSLDYDYLVSYMRGGMDYAEYIDLFPYLELEDYYRTDLHWAQDKIADCAAALLAGMDAGETGDLEAVDTGAVLSGTYAAETGLEPDELRILESETLKSCTAYNYETSSACEIYDMQAAFGEHPYDMFLGGSVSLVSIENPGAETDRELVIFRDSFASSLAPLLADGYARITLVDIRYIASSLLDRFVDFHGQDVLFLYSVPVLNNSITLK